MSVWSTLLWVAGSLLGCIPGTTTSAQLLSKYMSFLGGGICQEEMWWTNQPCLGPSSSEGSAEPNCITFFFFKLPTRCWAVENHYMDHWIVSKQQFLLYQEVEGWCLLRKHWATFLEVDCHLIVSILRALFEGHINISVWHQKNKTPSEYMQFNPYKHTPLSDCSSPFGNQFWNDRHEKYIIMQK